MKTLVIGGAGFVGVALTEALSENCCDVFVIDDCSTGQNGGDALAAADTYWRDDITKMSNDEAAPAFLGADVVFNLVGRTWHHGSFTHPVLDAKANLLAPLRVLELARIHCPQAHVIYAGTRAQYGRIRSRPVDESHPMDPLDVSSVHKRAAEAQHFLFAKRFGMKVTSLRLPNIVGPRNRAEEPDGGVMNWFLSQAARGKKIRAVVRERDVLHVSEVVDALLLAAGNKKCFSEAFNIGGRSIRLIDYARMVAAQLPAPVELLEEESGVEVGDYLADAGKFREATGWALSPRPFDELLAETAKWYGERFGSKEKR